MADNRSSRDGGATTPGQLDEETGIRRATIRDGHLLRLVEREQSSVCSKPAHGEVCGIRRCNGPGRDACNLANSRRPDSAAHSAIAQSMAVVATTVSPRGS